MKKFLLFVLKVPIKHAEEVDEVFDHIIYAKGSTVVRMAEFVLGKENFRKGLQYISIATSIQTPKWQTCGLLVRSGHECSHVVMDR